MQPTDVGPQCQGMMRIHLCTTDGLLLGRVSATRTAMRLIRIAVTAGARL